MPILLLLLSIHLHLSEVDTITMRPIWEGVVPCMSSLLRVSLAFNI